MKRMKPLVNTDYEIIKWDLFDNLHVIRISSIADGNCMFHAICKAFFKPYILGKVDNRPIDRKKFVINLRKDLSKVLGSKIEPLNPNSKTYYETLAKGELSKIGKEMNEYSLENMQKVLDSNSPLSNEYNEFISNQLNVDIYILDAEKKDVYMTATEDKLIYKKRNSIILLYLPGHYELIGITDSPEVKNITTFFKYNDPIIKIIRKRMNELRH